MLYVIAKSKLEFVPAGSGHKAYTRMNPREKQARKLAEKYGQTLASDIDKESQTERFDKATLGPVKMPKEAHRDKRFSPMVNESFAEKIREVEDYLKTGKKLASASDDEYEVVITGQNGREFIVKKDDQKHPVPTGLWMNWWEPNHEKYFGVTEEDYKKMPLDKKAEVEAKLQLKLWVKREYYNHFADFYYPEEYDKWWWDEGGSKLIAHGGAEVSEKHWKDRMKQSDEVKKSGDAACPYDNLNGVQLRRFKQGAFWIREFKCPRGHVWQRAQ